MHIACVWSGQSCIMNVLTTSLMCAKYYNRVQLLIMHIWHNRFYCWYIWYDDLKNWYVLSKWTVPLLNIFVIIESLLTAPKNCIILVILTPALHAPLGSKRPLCWVDVHGSSKWCLNNLGTGKRSPIACHQALLGCGNPLQFSILLSLGKKWNWHKRGKWEKIYQVQQSQHRGCYSLPASLYRSGVSALCC